MYSLHFYGQMLADFPRMHAYAAALRQAIRPDSVVMDLGCGPGVFALLACKLGARRVYAVEPNNVVGLAREAAAANGFVDRIEFFEKLSTEIALPEPATIIVSDLRGVLPFFQQNLRSIIDARKRLMAPGGVLIPRRDILWAAVVEAPEQYAELVSPWQNQFNLDLSAGTRFITNNWRKTHIKPEQFLAEPVCWNTIDYHEVESHDVRAEISWRAARNGIAHGFAVWFDSELVDDIGFSNHPSAPRMIYGQGFFPFSHPVEILKDDRIDLRLVANFVQDNYVWRWDTDFTAQERMKASFRQSTFYGVPLSAAQLREVAR
ncbi:MAG TPA: 50S ribosomal protein L11 methyltransferase [Pyrinomonadaceae bacterium]|nr:50S ribosomal protein L11 methyltransferase [Pyrinomonadaceae bacterium]